jgi:predicted  nucleic acid-binding Zn-ribbon protein
MPRKKKTTEQFIKEAIKKHGYKYDYSKVNYIGVRTKVCIICLEHGEFWQEPSNHLKGQGCPVCSGNKKLTTEQFIKEAQKVHGDKYDYSKVNYVNNHTNVCIICPEHGEFYQTPSHHLHGQGCPDCDDNKKKLTTEQFIKKAIEVHGDKYDYSKVEYVNSETKVCIICPEHGEFWQVPHSHLNGNGCPDCGGNKRKTTEQFIKKAIEVHGDKYDYSKVEYINANTKVCIICPEHGEFWQTPRNHLNGKGCLDCCGSRKKTTEQFIKEAREVHGNKYDYSKVDYVNGKTKVCIICPKHGEFYQKPERHLQGQGCPKCNSSKLESEISNYFPEFEREKTFDWLKDKKPLRLDFYDDDLKLGIECQGLQHFTPVNHFGGKRRFDKGLRLDKLKYKQCHEHGIDIVYYYTDDTNDLDFYKDKICFYNPEDLFTFIRNRKDAQKINN